MGTNLLVLDDLKENGPRDVIGVHSALDDVSLVYALNQRLGWGLSRLAQDHVVRLKDRVQHFMVYAWRDDFTDIHLLINHPMVSQWHAEHQPEGVGLFDAVGFAVPKTPLIKKRPLAQAVLILSDPLTKSEIVPLIQRCKAIPLVLQCIHYPWMTLRDRHQLILEPLVL
ncbi:MAG: hypothetical protein ACKVKW_00980 [Flavobacteriales bacterium]